MPKDTISNPCPGADRYALGQRARPEDLDDGGNHDPATAEFVGDCSCCKATNLALLSRDDRRPVPHEIRWDA